MAFRRAGDCSRFARAIAFLRQYLGAVIASAGVALLLALVIAASQLLAASMITAEIIFLTTLQRLLHAATATSTRNQCMARRTGARMAEQRARVRTIVTLEENRNI